MTNELLFWLSGDLLHFCLSYYFQKDSGYEINAIIDVPNKPKKFFQEQKLVNFKNSWFLHDYIKNTEQKPDLEYLEKFEKKYQINLMQLAINERIFYRFNEFYQFSSNQILNILSQECKLFEEILEKTKPDYFITTLTSFHHDHLFYEICKRKNIKVLMIYMSKLGHRCVISQQANYLDFEIKLSDVKTKNRGFDELLDYFKSFDIVKQIENYKSKAGTSKLKKFQALKNFLKNGEQNSNQTNYPYYGRDRSKVLLFEIKKSRQVQKRYSFINKNLGLNIPQNEKFVYYPLHIEQERNLLLAAPFFTNQIELIRNIAKSLPISYKLLVKEHPAQETREWRAISDYKKIMKIPNVILIHPTVPSQEILEKCSLVVTIGGTTGLEAAFYRKPSIILSQMDYSILPSVEFVQDVHELSNKIKESLEKEVEADDLDRFIQIYEKNSFEFDYMDFVTKYHESFYFNGNLLDTKINENDMRLFLQENEDILKNVTNEHIKKIKKFNRREINEK